MKTEGAKEITINIIVPDLSIREIISKTGRGVFLDRYVSSPPEERESGKRKVILFSLGKRIHDFEVVKEYKKRGLKPATAIVLAALNLRHPSFSFKYPNATQWRKVDYFDRRKFCKDFNQIIFFHSHTKKRRSVSIRSGNMFRGNTVYLNAGEYSSDIWFAGIKK